MKELKIEIPANHEIDQEKSTFERIVFKEVKKEITERISSFTDVCLEAGTTEEEFTNKYSILDKQSFATEQFKLIVKVMNEGAELDWNNTNQSKYRIWWNMRGKGSFGDVLRDCFIAGITSRLYFKERKLAEYIGKHKNFYDILNTYFKG